MRTTRYPNGHDRRKDGLSDGAGGLGFLVNSDVVCVLAR